MNSPSRPRTQFGRRDVLRLAPAVGLIAACAPVPDAPDPLAALDRAARSDAALARSIAQAHTELSAAAIEVATVRTEHARALRRELDRMHPPDPDAPRPKDPAPPKAPASASEAATRITDALRSAQRSAGDLVTTLPTYRAGLVGSVSASCAGLLEVLG